MILGVVFGTYSSIYIANTVLVRLKFHKKLVFREDDNKKFNINFEQLPLKVTLVEIKVYLFLKITLQS